MHLNDDWSLILRRAWSVRFLIAAAVLTGCEAVVTATGVDWIPLPHWARGLILFALVSAALVARIVAQRNLGDD